MNENISITETEWIVMESLWNCPNQTIGELKASLCDMKWSDSTIKTLLRRLVQKGAVKADDSTGHFVYSSLVEERKCKQKETRHFLSRIYHGSLKLLMTNLASESNLTREETKKLMEIIDKMEGEEPK